MISSWQIKNGLTGAAATQSGSASPTTRKQHWGYNMTWLIQDLASYNVCSVKSCWSADWCRSKPPPASPSHPWQVCEPWRSHLTPASFLLRPTSDVVSKIVTGIHHVSELNWLAVSAPITPKAEMSNEGAGVVTAEDHGRRGSHHSEERRVLGAVLRRHSCTFLGAIQLQGRVSYF